MLISLRYWGPGYKFKTHSIVDILVLCFGLFQSFVMTPPLGAGGLCRPVGPSDQPWQFCGISRSTHGGNSLKILHADASWPPSGLIRLWSRSNDFPLFGARFGFSGHFPENAWKEWPEILMCPEIEMLMCPDHLQNWLDYGHGLFIFFILVQFLLSETSQMWDFRSFPGEPIKENCLTFARWCIVITSRTG